MSGEITDGFSNEVIRRVCERAGGTEAMHTALGNLMREQITAVLVEQNLEVRPIAEATASTTPQELPMHEVPVQQ